MIKILPDPRECTASHLKNPPKGKLCEFREITQEHSPAGLWTWQCDSCRQLATTYTPENKKDLYPYLVLMTNQAIDMMNSQCEGCEKYQASRPECPMVQAYFRGSFPPGCPPAWKMTKEGAPVCTDRVAYQAAAVSLPVFSNAASVPEIPPKAKAEVRPVILWHEGTDALLAVEADEVETLVNRGGADQVDVVQGECLKGILMRTIYSKREN